MKYYNVHDIMQITGAKQNKAYEIIRELQKNLKKNILTQFLYKGKF